MADNKNGVWLDRETGKVVTSQPVRGRLIVTPGGKITKNVQSLIDRYEANYATVEQATAPDVPEKREAGGTCAGTTASGNPCSKKAGDDGYCHLHDDD